MHMLVTHIHLRRVLTVTVEQHKGLAAMRRHQLVQVPAASAQHLILGRARAHPQAMLGMGKAHALLGQGGGDVVVVGQYLVRQFRAGGVENTENAHQGRVLVGCEQRAMITAAAKAAALAIPKVKVGPSSFQL
ncbi:hypothetical protein D9M71_479710 [compost metagenome]